MTSARACKRKPAAQHDGWIYVAEGEGRFKIGWTRQPAKRIDHLERKTGTYLHVWALMPGTRTDERALHQRWSHLHIEGEWFRADAELLAWAEEVS